jgi:hypothetical protein
MPKPKKKRTNNINDLMNDLTKILEAKRILVEEAGNCHDCKIFVCEKHTLEYKNKVSKLFG